MDDAICSVEGCSKPKKRYGRLCSMHAERLRVNGSVGQAGEQKASRLTGVECYVDGCAKRRKGHRRYCSMHTARLARNGGVDVLRAKPPRERYISSHGYVNVRAPGHPMADSRDIAYEHRKVLFDAIGPGDHTCAWCRKPISWNASDRDSRLQVDHFNADRADNHPDNLLPSCRICNTARVDPYTEYKNGAPRRAS